MVRNAASDARKHFAETIRQAQHAPVTIERRGQREVVLVEPELFDRLMEAAEELDDIAAYDDAMRDEGENVLWNRVKADLGWE